MATEKNKAAIAYRDGLVYKVVTGFENAEAGERWLRFASIDNFHALRDQKTGRAAQLEVVTLAEANRRKGLAQSWKEAEEIRAAEIAEQERLARERAERERLERERAERERQIQALMDEQLKRELEERKARWRAAAEAELEQREQGDAA